MAAPPSFCPEMIDRPLCSRQTEGPPKGQGGFSGEGRSRMSGVPGDSAISLRDISIRLSGLQILDSVSIDVPKGAVTGLIGPNGAGKTTVFNVLSGFLSADSGTVTINGALQRRIRPQRLTKLGVSRTLQGVGLFASLSALDNVMLGGSSSIRTGIIADGLAMPWADSRTSRLRERALAVMDELGVADARDRLPAELPYPVQKRVALARALVSDPSIVLLDEPAGGVSVGDIAELGALIRSWTPQRTVLLVEHHMDLVMNVCDLIWVLDAGKVIASGTPAEIRNNPAVLEAYLGHEEAV
jgi:branched-chain amino acid transport system ATP-binding protein